MIKIIQGDCLELLRELPPESVQCCVTSPPYWGLRDYGVEGQIGLEKTPEEYVAKMVDVFREVKRLLRNDGVLFLNLGDTYWAGKGQSNYAFQERRESETLQQEYHNITGMGETRPQDGTHPVLKPKDLVGIPWRVAFALRSDGWYLRQDIIWHKPNPMPESVTDRCTKAHEYIFLLSKSQKYYYDAEAIKEVCTCDKLPGHEMTDTRTTYGAQNGGNSGLRDFRKKYHTEDKPTHRNRRSVWTVPTAPYSEAHFATFPPDLIKPCILAGTSARGCCPHCGSPWERITENSPMEIDRSDRTHELGRTRSSGTMTKPPQSKTIGWEPGCECGFGKLTPCTVLDPFAGSGTTGQVAIELGRKAVLIELNPTYVDLIKDRTFVTPGLPL